MRSSVTPPTAEQTTTTSLFLVNEIIDFATSLISLGDASDVHQILTLVSSQYTCFN